MAAYDLAAIYRQLATLLGAGISPAGSFDVLAQQSLGGAKKQFEAVSRQAWRGERLSDAMALLPRLFPATHRALMAEGETTGRIDTILTRLAEMVEYSLELRRSLVGELWRPGLILIVALPFVIFLLPKVAGAWWTVFAWVLIVFFFLLLLLAFQVTQLPGKGRGWATKAARWIPGLSRISDELTQAYFIRSLSVLYTAGVPITPALRCAANSSGDARLTNAVRRAVAATERGESITSALEKAEIFPPLTIAMAQTGQTTGDLDGIFGFVARYFEQSAQVGMHILCIRMGVAGLVIVGVIVGIIVIRFWGNYFGAFR